MSLFSKLPKDAAVPKATEFIEEATEFISSEDSAGVFGMRSRLTSMCGLLESQYRVQKKVQLAMTKADFMAKLSDFVAAVAKAAKVSTDSVQIGDVREVQLPAARRLLATGVEVSMEIATNDASSLAAASASLDQALSSGSLNADLEQNGCPSISMIGMKTTTTTPETTATATATTTPTSSGQGAGASLVGTMVVSCLVSAVLAVLSA